MNIEITKAEALNLASAQLRNSLYEYGIHVTLADETADGCPKITSANKIELIKFARRVVADALTGIIIPAKDADGSPFFGLADAKRYVETYFNFHN